MKKFFMFIVLLVIFAPLLVSAGKSVIFTWTNPCFYCDGVTAENRLIRAEIINSDTGTVYGTSDETGKECMANREMTVNVPYGVINIEIVAVVVNSKGTEIRSTDCGSSDILNYNFPEPACQAPVNFREKL